MIPWENGHLCDAVPPEVKHIDAKDKGGSMNGTTAFSDPFCASPTPEALCV